MVNELGSEPLPVRKHGRHALYELPHLGGEGGLALPVEQNSYSEPPGDHRLSRLKQLGARRILDRAGLDQLLGDAFYIFPQRM